MSSATKKAKAFQGTDNFSRPTMTALPRDVQHGLVMGPTNARMKFFEGQERMRLQRQAEEAAALAAQVAQQKAQIEAQLQANHEALAQRHAAEAQELARMGVFIAPPQPPPQPSLLGPTGFHVPSTGFSRRKRSHDDE